MNKVIFMELDGTVTSDEKRCEVSQDSRVLFTQNK